MQLLRAAVSLISGSSGEPSDVSYAPTDEELSESAVSGYLQQRESQETVEWRNKVLENLDQSVAAAETWLKTLRGGAVANPTLAHHLAAQTARSSSYASVGFAASIAKEIDETKQPDETKENARRQDMYRLVVAAVVPHWEALAAVTTAMKEYTVVGHIFTYPPAVTLVTLIGLDWHLRKMTSDGLKEAVLRPFLPLIHRLYAWGGLPLSSADPSPAHFLSSWLRPFRVPDKGVTCTAHILQLTQTTAEATVVEHGSKYQDNIDAAFTTRNGQPVLFASPSYMMCAGEVATSRAEQARGITTGDRIPTELLFLPALEFGNLSSWWAFEPYLRIRLGGNATSDQNNRVRNAEKWFEVQAEKAAAKLRAAATDSSSTSATASSLRFVLPQIPPVPALPTLQSVSFSSSVPVTSSLYPSMSSSSLLSVSLQPAVATSPPAPTQEEKKESKEEAVPLQREVVTESAAPLSSAATPAVLEAKERERKTKISEERVSSSAPAPSSTSSSSTVTAPARRPAPVSFAGVSLAHRAPSTEMIVPIPVRRPLPNFQDMLDVPGMLACCEQIVQHTAAFGAPLINPSTDDGRNKYWILHVIAASCERPPFVEEIGALAELLGWSGLTTVSRSRLKSLRARVQRLFEDNASAAMITAFVVSGDRSPEHDVKQAFKQLGLGDDADYLKNVTDFASVDYGKTEKMIALCIYESHPVEHLLPWMCAYHGGDDLREHPAPPADHVEVADYLTLNAYVQGTKDLPANLAECSWVTREASAPAVAAPRARPTSYVQPTLDAFRGFKASMVGGSPPSSSSSSATTKSASSNMQKAVALYQRWINEWIKKYIESAHEGSVDTLRAMTEKHAGLMDEWGQLHPTGDEKDAYEAGHRHATATVALLEALDSLDQDTDYNEAKKKLTPLLPYLAHTVQGDALLAYLASLAERQAAASGVQNEEEDEYVRQAEAKHPLSTSSSSSSSVPVPSGPTDAESLAAASAPSSSSSSLSSAAAPSHSSSSSSASTETLDQWKQRMQSATDIRPITKAFQSALSRTEWMKDRDAELINAITDACNHARDLLDQTSASGDVAPYVKALDAARRLAERAGLEALMKVLDTRRTALASIQEHVRAGEFRQAAEAATRLTLPKIAEYFTKRQQQAAPAPSASASSSSAASDPAKAVNEASARASVKAMHDGLKDASAQQDLAKVALLPQTMHFAKYSLWPNLSSNSLKGVLIEICKKASTIFDNASPSDAEAANYSSVLENVHTMATEARLDMDYQETLQRRIIDIAKLREWISGGSLDQAGTLANELRLSNIAATLTGQAAAKKNQEELRKRAWDEKGKDLAPRRQEAKVAARRPRISAQQRAVQEAEVVTQDLQPKEARSDRRPARGKQNAFGEDDSDPSTVLEW